MTRKNPYIVTVNRISEFFKYKNDFLGRLDIELTERCNNNCVHCCINLAENDKAHSRELPTWKLQEILTEAAALGVLTVRFTGGEPLLREDFSSLYLFARRLGLKVILFTNARLITPDIADLLARIPPLELVEVTVYGMSKESYEAGSRIPGSYKEFKAGIELLLDRKIAFVVKAPVLPSNREEMDKFEQWAATIPAMSHPPSYSMNFDLRCRRDLPERNRLISSIRLSPEETLSLLTRNGEYYLHGMKQFCMKFLGPCGDRLFPCGAGHGACVDAYGRLQPCLSLRDPACAYDMLQGTLKDGITRFFPALREAKAKNPDYLARCAQCFLKGLCEQCPAKSWAEYGTLDTPVDYWCEIAHVQARYLGLVQEGERAWKIEDWEERIWQFAHTHSIDYPSPTKY